jgi:hypothetical protein
MKESMRVGRAVVLLITALAVECRAQHPVASGFGIEMRLLGSFGASTGPVDVANIPATLRTVPSNQYGPLSPGTPVTIPVSTISISGGAAAASIGLAPQYTLRRVTLRAGALVSFMNLSVAPPSVGSQAEYASFPELNQFGTNQRGVGTSLVYYDVYWSRATPTIIPFGELEFRLNRFASLVGGYSGKQRSTANIQTGYDQYDALSTYSDQKLASVTSDGSPYGGIKIALVGPYAGLLIGAAPVNWERLSSAYPITTGFNGKRGVQVMLGMGIGWTRVKRP